MFPPFRPSDSMVECWQTTEQLRPQTLSFVQHWVGIGRGGGAVKKDKKRLKVVAFPTLLTISSDFSTLRNMLFQTQENLSLHFDLGPLES